IWWMRCSFTPASLEDAVLFFLRARIAGREQPRQFVEQGDLALVNLLAGASEREPGCAVDLRELLPAAGARRPFHRKQVAPDGCRIAVGLDGPGVNDLAAGRLARREGDEVAAAGEAGLLGEFAPRRLQRVFVGAEFALGNRPGMRILPRPERTAGVDEEDFDPAVTPPEQQKA